MTQPSDSAAWTGSAALLGAIVLFSTVEIASKAIQVTCDATIDPYFLVFLRFFVTGLCLLAIGLPAAWRRGLRLRPADAGILALNGFVGVALSITLFHVAILAFRNASSSAVVFSANPVFVALLAPLINRETLTWRKALAVLLGGSGVLCFAFESGRPESDSIKGLLVMLASAALFACSVCISRRIIPRYGPMVTMGGSALFGSLMVLPFGLWHSQVPIGPELVKAIWPVTYLVLGGTAAGYGLYYYGLARTSAYRASVSFFLKPVLATVLAVVIRHERLNAYTIGGTALVLVGLILALLSGRVVRAAAKE